MKALSVKQPYAAYICAGIKTVENRPRNTDYRGKLLIHASGKPIDWIVWDCIPQSFLDFVDEYDRSFAGDAMLEPLPADVPALFKQYVRMLEKLWRFYGVEPKDISGVDANDEKWWKAKVSEYGCALPAQAIIGEVNLVDVVQDSKDFFAIPDRYHWIFSEPVWYDKPVTNVIGHLGIWNYERGA